MLLFSSAKPALRFTKLNQIEDRVLYQQCLESVTMWFTDEWGYLHDKDKPQEQALEERQRYLAENAENIYLAFYGELIVGSFRIESKEYDEELMSSQVRCRMQDKLQTNEIWFVYVDEAYRSLGFGRQIVRKIKDLSQSDKPANIVLLETLKPSLNHLYQTEGAKVICENQILHYPADVLKISL